MQYEVITFGLFPSVVFLWFLTVYSSHLLGLVSGEHLHLWHCVSQPSVAKILVEHPVCPSVSPRIKAPEPLNSSQEIFKLLQHISILFTNERHQAGHLT